MLCLACEKEKVSSAFLLKNLTDSCDHPPYVCMRCLYEENKDVTAGNGGFKCPAVKPTTCSATTDNDYGIVAEALQILEILYPPVKTFEAPASGTGEGETITVGFMGGDSHVINIQGVQTVPQLAEKIKAETGLEVSKQALFHGTVPVQLYDDKKERLLEDYGISKGVYLLLAVRKAYIPNYVEMVSFTFKATFSRNILQFILRKKDRLLVKCFASSNVDGSDKLEEIQVSASNFCKFSHETSERTTESKLELDLKQIPAKFTRFFFTVNSEGGAEIDNFKQLDLSLNTRPTLDDADAVKTDILTRGRQETNALIVCTMVRHDEGGWEVYSIGKKAGGKGLEGSSLKELLKNEVEKLNKESSEVLKNLKSSTDVHDKSVCILS